MPRRVVLCSIGTGPHAELLDLTRPSFDAWATRQGYDVDLRYESPASERAPSWGKLRLVGEHLDTHDVVVWVDADCVVIDPSHDISELVDRRRPVALVAHTYAGQTVPNLGVFVMRSNVRNKRLVRRLWSMTQFLDHKWWENAALLELLGYDISTEPIHKVRSSHLERRIRWLDKAWNSLDLDASEHPIIKHYPGLTNDERRRRMTADLM